MSPRKAALTPAKKTALDWVRTNEPWLSQTHSEIWNFHETAWREYRSAEYYMDLLRAQGFEVEEGTADHADGVPRQLDERQGRAGRSPPMPNTTQCPATARSRALRKPRAGLHKYAAGHTDPHSALGCGALGGLLAAKAAMEKHGIPGTLKFFGEPAEKVCGSKPIHAAHGYYDDLDAAISFHPAYFRTYSNTTVWTPTAAPTGARSTLSNVRIRRPGRRWAPATAPIPPHLGPRARRHRCGVPDVHDLQIHKEAMLPHTGTWTINEAILPAGQATSDNLAAQFRARSSTPAGRRPCRCRSASSPCSTTTPITSRRMTHCTVRKGWVTKTRPGLPNHVMAGLCYPNLELAGPPAWGEEARKFGREIQKNLGLKPMEGSAHAGDGRVDRAGSGRGAPAPGPAGLAEELHLRRLHRLHLALRRRCG